jgi:hypothetical protein
MFAPVLDSLLPTAAAADAIVVPTDIVDLIDQSLRTWRSGEPQVDLDWGMTGAWIGEEPAAEADDDQATTVH